MEKYHFTGGFLSNSDAHDLIAIQDGARTLEVSALTAQGVIDAVRNLGK